MTKTNYTLDDTLNLLRASLCVVPSIREEKRPQVGQWKRYTKKLPTEAEITEWFYTYPDGWGFICGSVSGGLEVLDFDNHLSDAKKNVIAWSELVENTIPGLIDRLVFELTLSGGYHVFYRTGISEGNLKLAQKYQGDKPVAVIETRGEGGFIQTAPTEGYSLKKGNFLNIDAITDDERNLLINTARTFQEVFTEIASIPVQNTTRGTNTERPGDVFNQLGDITSDLKSAGWQHVGNHNNIEHWRRPGKDHGSPSATRSFSQRAGKMIFWVFSTNAHPFESHKAYDNFAVYTYLNYNGDFSQAGKQLLKDGYGTPGNEPVSGLGQVGSEKKMLQGGELEKSSVTVNKSGGLGFDINSLGILENTIFWQEEWVGKKCNCIIKQDNLIQFLEFHGFGKYWIDDGQSLLVRLVKNVVHIVNPEKTADFILTFVKNKLPDYVTANISRQQLQNKLVAGINLYCSEIVLKLLKHLDLEFIRDTKDNSFFFLKNCIIKTNKEKATTYKYDQIKGYVWEKQIKDHDVDLIDTEKSDNCIFSKFLYNVCSVFDKQFPNDRKKRIFDKKRFAALCSSIGYLLHTYKDKRLAKAIIFCEEMLTNMSDANGRTGKGVTMQAIKEVRKCIRLDGKQFNFKKNFIYQEINPDDQIVYFDDVEKNFPFEFLFSVLTEGISIEKKGKTTFQIDFKDSAKIVIITNYVLKGDNESHKARKHEVEFTDYYSSSYTPFDDFSHTMFDDWDSKEWNLFFNFMIYCSIFYLKNGLYNYEQKNLSLKRLLQNTGEDFVEFMDTENVEENTWINRKDLYLKFTKIYEDYSKKNKYNWTQNKFLFALKKYAKYKKLDFEDKRKRTYSPLQIETDRIAFFVFKNKNYKKTEIFDENETF